MSQAIALPLIEQTSNPSENERSLEEKQIQRICSTNPMAISLASKWLERNGDSATANKLEKLLDEKDLPSENRKAIGNVLLSLSHRHKDFAQTDQGKLKRLIAIYKATLRGRIPKRPKITI